MSFFQPRSYTGAKSPYRRWIVGGAIGLSLLLVIGVSVAWALAHHKDPRLVEIERLQAQLFADGHHPWDPENRELMQQLRQKIDALPPEMRQQFEKQMMEEGMKRGAPAMNQAMADFFAKSPAEQQAVLDAQLDRNMEWQKNGGPFGPPPGSASGKSDGSGSSSTDGKGNPPPPPFGPPPATDQQRVQRWQGMLQNVPPQQRAQFTAWHQMMQQRAAQRGLPSSAAWGPPPGVGPPR